jgi:hypothetical protein
MNIAEHKAESTAAHDNGAPPSVPRRHAVIAGTGRAGTSFLVRFLDRCGLETNVAGSVWSQKARAGHEHALDSQRPLPYVVKDPFLFSYCADLDLTRLTIDALIVPVRDLMLAAGSRVHQERLAILDNPTLRNREVQLAAAATGGVLYSLDVVDQARILAVGFHRLLHWAIANELPLFLLEFPRMVEDSDYTLRTLWPWLGEHCSSAAACRAFTEVADVNAVRITTDVLPPGSPLPLGPREPDQGVLDRTALLERLDESAAALKHAQSEVARLGEEMAEQQLTITRLREEARHNEFEANRLRDHAAALKSQMQAEHSRGEALETSLTVQRARAESAAIAHAHAEHWLAEIQTSASWRITVPLRAGIRSLRRLTGRDPRASH